jgi:hypothetical protein
VGTHISNNPLSAPFLYKGVISVSSDFPNPLSVKVGWVYAVIQDVTDNDPTKTNTGQSFLLGDEIVWNGLNWTEFGSIDLWFDEGTSLRPINTRDINVNSNNITNIKYSDYLNTFSNPSYQEGAVFYDKDKHALSYYNEEPDVTVNLGQELLIRVKNETGNTILNGLITNWTQT